jgi:hypothetical protein
LRLRRTNRVAMVDRKGPVAREAAATARTLVKARANAEVEFFALVLRDAVARGSAFTGGSGDTEKGRDPTEQSDWQYALIASLATLGAVALNGGMGLGNADREEVKRRVDAWIGTMAEKDLTF